MSRARDIADQQDNLGGAVAPYVGGKNSIINGGMDIWQRGTSITTSNTYTADRWAEVSGNSTVYTRSTDVPSSLGFQYSISRAGTGSNMNQRIEAANAAQLAGQTVTLSFYYKSTAGADNFSTFFYYANSADNFAAVTQIGSTQTIATPATSWTRVSYTFTSISANAANGLAIYFARGLGATSTTLITGVQLELGSTATTFSRAGGTIQGELAACQRYYWRTSNNGGNTICNFGVGIGISTTTARILVNFPVALRANFTSIDYSTLAITDNAGYQVAVTTLANYQSCQTNAMLLATSTTASVVYLRTAFMCQNSSSSGYLGFSAEL